MHQAGETLPLRQCRDGIGQGREEQVLLQPVPISTRAILHTACAAMRRHRRVCLHCDCCVFIALHSERLVFLNNAFIFSSAVLTFGVEAVNRSQTFGSNAAFYARTKTINARPEIVTTLMNHGMHVLG